MVDIKNIIAVLDDVGEIRLVKREGAWVDVKDIEGYENEDAPYDYTEFPSFDLDFDGDFSYRNKALRKALASAFDTAEAVGANEICIADGEVYMFANKFAKKGE